MSAGPFSPVQFRLAAVAFVALWLTACATPSQRAAPQHLFDDAIFERVDIPSEREIFALNDAMQKYVRQHVGSEQHRRNPPAALAESLYRKSGLQLEYESDYTRNASEAFTARSGNCLSLVIMTAALAREIGLRVTYQSAYLEEYSSIKGDLLLSSGHVNITLAPRVQDLGPGVITNALMIDFLPASQLRGLRTHEIPESLIVSMYMNNRAVETLLEGKMDKAYAWARAAILRSPDFLAAQNTLGVIYLRRGAEVQASAVFDHLLASDPSHTRALANLAEIRTRQGRVAEAEQLRLRLAYLEREGPLRFFRLGLAAMQRQDYRAARDHFAREAERSEPSADLLHWLSRAHYHLGDFDLAAEEMARAARLATRLDRDRYSAKLAWLREQAQSH